MRYRDETFYLKKESHCHSIAFMSNSTLSTASVIEEAAPSAVTSLNPQVELQTEKALCVVWVNQAPWYRFVVDNAFDRRVVGANLVLAGLASTVEVVRGLGISRATLHRDRQKLMEEGLLGLATVRRGRQGPTKVTPKLRARAKAAYRQGEAKRAIARQLGVSEGTIRRLLRGERRPQEGSDAVRTAVDAEEIVSSPDVKPSDDEALEPGLARGFDDWEAHPPRTTVRDLDRRAERVQARFGLLTEASVRFVSGTSLRFVGVLLMLPALVSLGFFQSIEAVYGRLKNGFYGLRHTVMTLSLMLALRLSRAEHLSGVPPAALGRLLGLDRAPEVKTLRRRLSEIAGLGKADRLMRWLGQRLVDHDPEVLGFLYIDGHVRAYFGQRPISKSYVTQRRLAMPAVNDFWVNDAHGEPLLVITGEVTASLSEHVPAVLDHVRELLGPDRRATVVFDRGGWSPKLFKRILKAGFDLLTYRKGRCPRYPVKDFSEHRLDVEGRTHRYSLRDGLVRPGHGLQLRCVVRRKDSGKQTSIVTNRRDLPAAEVAYRMFERWRQENYFKYAGEEFALDALETYEVEASPAERSVPNPARRALDPKIRALRQQAKTLEAELGRAMDAHDEHAPTSLRDFNNAQAELRQRLENTRQRLDTLIARRRRLPRRVALSETLPPGETPVQLAVEHKHFMNIAKMAVYRAETGLYRLLEPHYRRNEHEGRALLREAFRSSGSLDVDQGLLRVTLDPLSAPRRTRAIAHLCGELNTLNTRIPGTSLRLCFAVQGEPCLK